MCPSTRSSGDLNSHVEGTPKKEMFVLMDVRKSQFARVGNRPCELKCFLTTGSVFVDETFGAFDYYTYISSVIKTQNYESDIN
jgi:hypothetical protein